MKRLIAAGCLCLATSSFASTLSTISNVVFLASHLLPDEIVVSATGTGATQKDAIDEALLASVQKGLGVMVVSDQSIENEKVVRNLAAMYSSGIVKSYEVNRCVKTSVYTCEVTALVSPWDFERQLKTSEVNGTDLYASYLTSKSALIQRNKIIDYYFSNIRKHGLQAKIHSVKVIPSTSDKAQLQISYSVNWNRNYRNSFIDFLEKLERDTNGSFDNHDLVLQWSSSNLFKGRAFLLTNDENTRVLIENKLFEPVFVYFDELNRCERIKLDSSILNFGISRKQIFEIDSDKLKGLRKISISTECKQ